jgi:NodT family efflux transporter outer membrane factor (OMF) lipoprotein
MMALPRLVWLALALCLPGCLLGPDYAGPPPVLTTDTGFARATPAEMAPPPLARWWEPLADPQLDSLMMRALAINPDLAATVARTRAARAVLAIRTADLRPTVGTQALYLHGHTSGVDFGAIRDGDSDKDGKSDFDYYSLGFNASWEVDLFGRQRRGVEAATAQIEAAEASLDDARLSLSANLTRTYVALRDRQRRLALARESEALRRQGLDLLRQRYDQGIASEVEIERQRMRIEEPRIRAAQLEAEVAARLDALAVLIGAAPGALDAELAPPTPPPLPPTTVTVGDPATLLRRRPDIRAAERALAADTAMIGIAAAARLPKLTLLGTLGVGGTDLSSLGQLDDPTLFALPRLEWALFDFGRAEAKQAQAEALRDETEARYRGVVLAALRDAEDALALFQASRERVAAQARTLAAAERAVSLLQQREQGGTANTLQRLDAEDQRVTAAAALSEAEADLTRDYAALQTALGLGWAESAPGSDPLGRKNTDTGKD